MKLADVSDGIVVNVVQVSPESVPEWAADWPELIEAEGAGIGWSWDGESFTPPPPEPEPDPEERRASMQPLTFLQLMIGLVAEEWISEAEGEDWVDGILPPAVEGAIAQLPAQEQFPAKARAKRFTIAERTDPLVAMLGQIEGKTPEELDAFFEQWTQV